MDGSIIRSDQNEKYKSGKYDLTIERLSVPGSGATPFSVVSPLPF